MADNTFADFTRRCARALLREIREVGVATFAVARRIVAVPVAAVQVRFSRRKLRHAQAVLGQAMFTHSKGEVRLCEQITQIDDRIESIRASGGNARLFAAERNGLLIRLASAATNSAPGDCESEHAALVKAKDDVDANENNCRLRKTELASTSVRTRAHAAIGAAIGYVVAVGVVALILRGPVRDNYVLGIHDATRLDGAIGLVVRGFQITSATAPTVERLDATGTCFAISADGFLLTNRHVAEHIEDYEEVVARKALRELGLDLQPTIWVFFGRDRKFLARVVYLSNRSDFAILKIVAHGMPAFRLSASSQVPRATDVYACGFPRAAMIPLSAQELSLDVPKVDQAIEACFKNRDFEFSTTKGVVGRVTSATEASRAHIQHTAEASAGSSGGPVMLENGIVVGINTLKSPQATISFALKVDQLRGELSQWVPAARWEQITP